MEMEMGNFPQFSDSLLKINKRITRLINTLLILLLVQTKSPLANAGESKLLL